MKVKITAYNAVAEWKWDLPEDAGDMCGICRAAYEGTCSKCKYPGDECPIMVGECRHSFHMHCITNWISSEASQGRCPMCRQVFKEKLADVKTPANAASAAQAGRPGTSGSSDSNRSR